MNITVQLLYNMLEDCLIRLFAACVYANCQQHSSLESVNDAMFYIHADLLKYNDSSLYFGSGTTLVESNICLII